MFDEKPYLIRVKLSSGATIYCLEEDDARAAKKADKAGRPIPPPKNKRNVPFGEGVKIEGDRYVCYYRDEFLGVFYKLEEALDAWDYQERHERFCEEEAARDAELDARYYGNLTYDKDGYKVFTPQPKG